MGGGYTNYHFPEKLKAILKLLRLTQKDLAIETGLTESAITHYLNGDRKPNYDSFWRIVKGISRLLGLWLLDY